MTGQDLFSALTILTMITCIVLQVKHKIELFDDNYWYDIIVTILFVLSLLSVIFMVIEFFIDNWKTQIL